MKLFLFWLLSLTYLFANPYENLHYEKLDNGLEVYLLPDEKSKNIRIEVSVRVGMKAESEQMAGISHLVEHVVFRDGRIPNRDYYDLIKDKGATDVNGYTSYYRTQYVTTINPENATWITKTFCQMLFDKNITQEDLRVEKGALQLEIGEPNWTDQLGLDKIGKFFTSLGDLFPPQKGVFESDFGIDFKQDKQHYHDKYIYKINNKKFTLNQVLKHYHDYYYPSNMRLKIVGKFDLKEMQETIAESFGKIPKSSGKSVTDPTIKDATLNDTPYLSYGGSGIIAESMAQIGMKMLVDDPQKILIVDSYIQDLAHRLNKEFRNKHGESYSVSGYLDTVHNATIAIVDFSTPHGALDKNIATAKAWMMKETAGALSDEMIQEALKQKKNFYDAQEHDVNSLMGMVEGRILFKETFPTVKENVYELLQQVTPEQFREVLKERFLPEHSFTTIQRDYIWFSYEGVVIMFGTIFLFFYLYRKFFGFKRKKRAIRLQRRISSRWISFVTIMIAILLSAIAYEWLRYGLEILLGISHDWENYLDIPLDYPVMVVDIILSIMTVFWVYKKLFSRYRSVLYIDDEDLIMTGGGLTKVPLSDIASTEVVAWSPSLFFKSYGVAMLFFRPLLKVVLKDNSILYIRNSNAKHLKEDIDKILFST